MANTKSAIKRIKQNEKRRQRNRAARSRLRSVTKDAAAALHGRSGEAPALVREAIRTLDKAVTQGVVHRNTAARRKSALARKLSTAS